MDQLDKRADVETQLKKAADPNKRSGNTVTYAGCLPICLGGVSQAI